MHSSTRAREVGEAAFFDLLDWKRRVFELYAAVRRSSDVPAAWRHWREVRAELFRTHPQSTLPPDLRGGAPGRFVLRVRPTHAGAR